MADGFIIQGEVEFKRGIVSRWRSAFCVLEPRELSVYDNKNFENKLHVFTPEQTWISAANKTDSGLFVLNKTKSKSTSIKSFELFLFDTKTHSALVEWTKGLQRAGWKSAVLSEKLRYHQRSTDFENGQLKKDNHRLDANDNSQANILREKKCSSINSINGDFTNENKNTNEGKAVTSHSPIPQDSCVESTSSLLSTVHQTDDQSVKNCISYNNTDEILKQESLYATKDLCSLKGDATELIHELNGTFHTHEDRNRNTDLRDQALPLNEMLVSNLTERTPDFDLNSNISTGLEKRYTVNNCKDTELYVREQLQNELKDSYNESMHSDLFNVDTNAVRESINDLIINRKEDGILPVRNEIEEPGSFCDHIKDQLSLESGYCSKESLSMSEENKATVQHQTKEFTDIPEILLCPKAELDPPVLDVLQETTRVKAPAEERRTNEEKEETELDTITNSDSQQQNLQDKPEVIKKFQEVKFAHEKLSKRQSMTNILSQFKNRISLNKKKASKKSESSISKVLFSTKLLWNDGDEWKDRWFKLDGDKLYCFKDTSMKSLEFCVDIRKCVTELTKGSVMQGMNIFTLTCENNEVYRLAAWSDHHLQNWIKALEKFSEKGLRATDETEGSLNDIVPYREALEIQEGATKGERVKATQKDESTEDTEQLHWQGSVDSSNDGDESESGLESSGGSLSGIKASANKRKHQLSRRKMGIAHPDIMWSNTLWETDPTDPNDREKNINSESNCALCPDVNSISATIVAKSIGPVYASQEAEVGGNVSEIPRSRHESTESNLSADIDSSSSVGSPCEKIMLTENFTYSKNYSTTVSSRKVSANSCTSFDSEGEKRLEQRHINMRFNICTGHKYLENGSATTSQTTFLGNKARQTLLEEVTRQRDIALRNLSVRQRTGISETGIHQRRANVSGTDFPNKKGLHPVVKTSSQDHLNGIQNMEVNTHNTVQMYEDAEIVHLQPMSSTEIREQYGSNIVDLKPVSVDGSTSNISRTRDSICSEDSDDYFSLTHHESQADRERFLRNETLLRKRRNSLFLTKKSLQQQLKSQKNQLNEEKENVDSTDSVNQLETLLSDTEAEIKSIESKLSLQTECKNEIVKCKPKTPRRAVFSRLRLPISSKASSSSIKNTNNQDSPTKESGFHFRKRSTSSLTIASQDRSIEARPTGVFRRRKKMSTSSEPRATEIGSSTDLRTLEDDVIAAVPGPVGLLKTRSKSVGSILQLNYTRPNESNGNSTLFSEKKKTLQRKISMDAVSKIEDFMEFSKEMVYELKSRKDSEETPDIIEV